MILYMYRQGKYIGRVEVSEVSQICSRIMALPETKSMQVGDAVSHCLQRNRTNLRRPHVKM